MFVQRRSYARDDKRSRSDRRWNYNLPCANVGPQYRRDVDDLRRPCPCSPRKMFVPAWF